MFGSYSCIHTTIEQYFLEFSHFFCIGTETPAHPLMKHEFKHIIRIFIGKKSSEFRESFAEGSRKDPGSHLGPTWVSVVGCRAFSVLYDLGDVPSTSFF